ncbi:MAG: hypothetical protein U0N99_08905, partial [Collinsella sp.]
HALLEVEDQVFGVHAAPIIAVYGVNDMAPWGHMYVNPGLTEPYLIPVPEKSICGQKGKSSQKRPRPKLATPCTDYSPGLIFA